MLFTSTKKIMKRTVMLLFMFPLMSMKTDTKESEERNEEEVVVGGCLEEGEEEEQNCLFI